MHLIVDDERSIVAMVVAGVVAMAQYTFTERKKAQWDSGDGKFPTVHQFDVQTETRMNDAMRFRACLLCSLARSLASVNTFILFAFAIDSDTMMMMMTMIVNRFIVFH